MEVFRLLLKLLIRLGILIEYKKSRTKGQCVIYFGQILMKEQDGVFLPEELGTPLDKTFQNNLTGQMIWS